MRLNFALNVVEHKQDFQNQFASKTVQQSTLVLNRDLSNKISTEPGVFSYCSDKK